MIEQYLPQTNESATVAKSKKISHLNNALFLIPQKSNNFSFNQYIKRLSIFLVHNEYHYIEYIFTNKFI
jgi:hypothetical protein